MNENEFFYNLTPHVIIDSVEREGYTPTGLCWKLNSLENRVYDLELDDKSHVVVKFYRPGRWSKTQILEEHEFLFDLVESEVLVCSPCFFKDGESLKEIEGIYYAVWKRTGGRCIDEFLEDHLANLGRLLGRLHTVGKKKEAKERLKLTSENMCRIPLSYLLNNSLIPSSCENDFKKAVEEASNIFDDLAAGVPYHRIHGDCHIGNLLYGDEGFFFLDFDDFYTGPAVQDFWMILSNNIEGTNIFLKNYRMFSDFENSWLKLMEPLRALRFVHYTGWIARRWEDPAFKNAFPHFGTKEYWQTLTKDLYEQIALSKKVSYIIRADGIHTEVSDDAPPVTNKDIFWDWEEKNNKKENNK